MQALAGAAIANIGMLAAANPTSALLKALSQAVPQLAATLPTVITACGAIVAALSQPPLSLALGARGRAPGDEDGPVLQRRAVLAASVS